MRLNGQNSKPGCSRRHQLLRVSEHLDPQYMNIDLIGEY